MSRCLFDTQAATTATAPDLRCGPRRPGMRRRFEVAHPEAVILSPAAGGWMAVLLAGLIPGDGTSQPETSAVACRPSLPLAAHLEAISAELSERRPCTARERRAGPGHAPWPFGLNDHGVCGVPPRTRCLRRSLRPEVRYARAENGVTTAYPVAGDGPVTIVVVSPLISQLQLAWEEPCPGALLEPFRGWCPGGAVRSAGWDCRIVRRRVSASILPPWLWMSRRRTQALVLAGGCVPRATHDSDTTPTLGTGGNRATRSRRHPAAHRADPSEEPPGQAEKGHPRHTRALLRQRRTRVPGQALTSA